jgi:4-hydroxy-tetrahydrodipicolinate synthase
LFDVIVGAADFPEGFRVAVELRGFAMGQGRQPLSASQRGKQENYRKALKNVLAEFGPL